VLMNIDDESTIEKVKGNVADFMKDFPLYAELGY